MGPKIEIGDKVKLINPSARTKGNRPSLAVGDVGTVVVEKNFYDVRTDWDAKLYGIEWSKPIANGHDCQGHCKSGHGSYVELNEIQKI
jgi:hypothetical protein